jgi:YggT family protein
MLIAANIIHRIIQLCILVIIIQAALSYFMSPFDTIRRMVDRIVDPVLSPIRRIISPVGIFDFSPIILIILLQFLDMILRSLLLAL